MLRHAWVWLVVGAVVALAGVEATAERQPAGQLTIAFDTTIAPTYLDPAETTGIAAPWSSPCPWSRSRTTRPRPGACWLKPATPTALRLAT